MSLITMFTDASWHRGVNVAVWATWAKCDGKTIRYSGQLREMVQRIGTAELAAIANGLLVVTKSFAPPIGERIIIQSDCKEALHAINAGIHSDPQANKIVKHIKSFASQSEYYLDLRHVKGHKGTATPRNAVNTWCDSECRRLIGIAIAAKNELQQTLALEHSP